MADSTTSSILSTSTQTTLSTSILPSSSQTTTTSPTTSPTLPDLPASTDTNPGSSSDPTNPGSGSSSDPNSTTTSTTTLYNYYFIFLALLVCVAGLLILYLLRRRRRRAFAQRHSREHALTRDLSGWNGRGEGARRRYWGGRWRSVTRTPGMGMEGQEGLNEVGEAPPPYAPKRSGEGNREGEQGDGCGEDGGVQVPLRTLGRRDEEGTKPPDYVETRVVEREGESSRPESARSANDSGYGRSVNERD